MVHPSTIADASDPSGASEPGTDAEVQAKIDARGSEMGRTVTADDLRERGLAEARGTEDQDMVQRFRALSRCGHEDFELFPHLGLAHVVDQRPWPDRPVQHLVFGSRLGGNETIGLHGA